MTRKADMGLVINDVVLAIHPLPWTVRPSGDGWAVRDAHHSVVRTYSTPAEAMKLIAAVVRIAP